MKKYTTYTTEDFVGNEDFRNWVRGESANEKFWKAFIEEHPYKQEIIKNAEQIIRTTNVKDEKISDGEIEREVDEFFTSAGKIKAYSTGFDPGKKLMALWPVWLKFSAAAAILIFGISLGWYFLKTTQNGPESLLAVLGINKMAETTNDSDKPLRLILSDHSIVILSPRSKLRYPSQFVVAVLKLSLLESNERL